MKKSNVMIGMFVGVILVIGIVVFFTTKAKTAELETISLDTKPITDTVEKVGTLEKYYNVTSETVTIKSYDTKTELAKIRLDTPINYKVGAGYQKVAQFTVSPYTDISSFIKSIELYNLNNDLQKFSRTIDIKYLSVGTKLVNDYKTECTETGIATKNGTRELSCEQVVIGTHYEDEWKTYDGLLKTDKEITIGLFTNVEVGDKVEWIPTFTISSTDVKVQEWATWTADLNVGLVSYYKLDETSGTTAIDSVRGFDGTISNGITINQAGKINKAIKGDNTANAKISVPHNNLLNGGAELSLGLWRKGNNSSLEDLFLKGTDTNTTRNYFIRIYQGKIWFVFHDGTTYREFTTTNVVTSNNNWEFIVATYNDANNNVSIYVNSNLVQSFTTTSSLVSNTLPLQLCGDVVGYTCTSFIDEMFIYNRTLTTDEITQLYNSGNGLPYEIQCNFSGYVKDSLSNGLKSSQIVIFNQDNKSEVYNTTTDVNGLWSIGIVNSTKNYTAVAYLNNSLIGQAKPFISGTC